MFERQIGGRPEGLIVGFARLHANLVQGGIIDQPILRAEGPEKLRDHAVQRINGEDHRPRRVRRSHENTGKRKGVDGGPTIKPQVVDIACHFGRNDVALDSRVAEHRN